MHVRIINATPILCSCIQLFSAILFRELRVMRKLMCDVLLVGDTGSPGQMGERGPKGIVCCVYVATSVCLIASASKLYFYVGPIEYTVAKHNNYVGCVRLCCLHGVQQHTMSYIMYL